MSDFLSRLAARAVGAPALARPRVATPHAGAGALEVVDEQVVVSAAAPAPPPAASSPRPAAALPGEAPARAGERPRPDAPDTPQARAPLSAALPSPAAELSVGGRPLQASERASVDPAGAEPGAPSAEPRVTAPRVTAIAAAVPATPAEAVVVPPAPVPAAASTATRAEPHPVRVHIGRLEVRANLPEPPRPAPLQQPAEPDGLSLSDYLRGKR